MHNTIYLRIKGKNINNFIYRIHHHNINIYKIDYLGRDEVRIEVLYCDYDNIVKIKTIYEVYIEQYNGVKKLQNNIKYHKYLLISIVLGIFLFTFLSNIIFDVEVSYSGKKIRDLVYKELESFGIKKYKFVKSFNEISKIKEDILNNNKDSLEWLEIERVGTKYIVKLEPRKIEKIVEDNKIYNIVSKRDAIIKSIEAYSGQIVKNINTYVKKGEVIISSNITLNEEVKNIVSAKGRVYGEVWYQIEVSYPLSYYEEKETGNSKEVYNIRLLNKDINFSKYKNKKIEEKIILKSDLLPIYFSYQKQKEIEIINYKLNKDEAIIKAMEKGRSKIEETLSEKEYIMDEKSLKIDLKDSKIIVDMFYTVYKDITEYIEIEG